VNAGGPSDLRAVTTAEESTYAGVRRLVREVQTSKAPFVLAALVVATPCPLILAARVAIVGGISREARRGLIVKGGGALEALARARQVLLDLKSVGRNVGPAA